ncbi:branched-chain amino acid ABC transporter permease [Aeromicrobium duanguangcaii]|uniref:Branched-chain amino acid ABC transporter permease n=1 Tax=Aeromicrobium duanguangcaii TaxID=2968086 RepID=A0ABY5KGV5_9ACTN|nr:branched-chain amino acid ABC transporter permease [Aeromicrobium duanguangcaii]MCD9155070.1 branched-chain amino acid ABC transporter permease [Aeromicrobium duanguangcaii]UUI68275.1 branched-chain amino acid ABC transporter permease [Aeromicrobium duanguangcaii]
MNILLQAIADGLILGGFYALMAQGLSLIFGIMRIVNLAHGELLIVGAYLAWALQSNLGIGVLWGLPIIALVGFGGGWLLSRTLILRVVDRPQLMPLLLTFGLASVVQGLLVWSFATTPRITTASYSGSVVDVFGIRVSMAQFVMLVLSLVLLGALTVFLQRTKMGRAMTAAAQNREAARIVGIDIGRIYSAAFGLGIAIVFVAGALFSVTQAFHPFMGAVLTLKAFVIVVLGGAGRVGGTLMAAMVVGLAEAFVSAYVPGIGTGLGAATAFILVVLVLAIRPEGISRAKAVA